MEFFADITNAVPGARGEVATRHDGSERSPHSFSLQSKTGGERERTKLATLRVTLGLIRSLHHAAIRQGENFERDERSGVGGKFWSKKGRTRDQFMNEPILMDAPL